MYWLLYNLSMLAIILAKAEYQMNIYKYIKKKIYISFWTKVSYTLNLN